ncbi:MerR family transcriptional regulator [Uniformispora flossi]|uniref:transcriptional regulator FtsR n=1 Tax=Uniformispora flossi TaxID=3390723 RepID=UPI003C2D5AD0
MTSTPPRAGGGRALVGIGEVMALLRPEFPDVSVSKIRFLEAEGLVEPQRTPSGYRKFGPSDLDRLRYVLRAQRDQYLPLKVIKDHLDAIDRGLEPAEDGLGAALAAADASPPAPVYFTRAELLAAAGIDDAALTRLEEFGLIEARRVVEVAGPGARGADADAAAGVPAARGSGAGADVVTGDVGFAVPGASADVRTVDAVTSAVTGPGGGVRAVRDAAADVVPGDGAAMAVDVLSAQVLDAQRNGSAGSPAARGAADTVDAADAAPDDAPGSGRTTGADADAVSSDVPSARAAVAPEPTGTLATVLGKPAPAADDAAATDSAASKTLPDAPESPTDAPSTASEALTSSSGPEVAEAAHPAPDAVAADTEANAASNPAPGAAETRTGTPDGPAADTPGRNQPGDVLHGPRADVRDQAQPGGSDTCLGPAADAGDQVHAGGSVGTVPGPAADTRVQEQPGADDALGTTAGQTASALPAPDREQPDTDHAVGTTAGETTSSSRAPDRPTADGSKAGGSTAPSPLATGAAPSAGAKPATRPVPARATASGADPAPRTVLRYDGDALVVARLVTALGEYGLEPRHLRQVKAAADREAALAEQIVAPLLHRRGAGAKSGAEETVRDLLSLTSRLHTVLVSSALRPLLDR